jgi:hypothetical protein
MRPALGALLLAACAQAQPRAPMPLSPQPLDFEKLVPAAPPPVEIPPGTPRYPDIQIDEGDCPGRPAGILASEAIHAERLRALIDRDRQAVAARTCRDVRRAEWAGFQAAEQAYLDRVGELEEQLAHQRRVGTLKLWGGFAAGVGLFLVSTWAVGKLRQ